MGSRGSITPTEEYCSSPFIGGHKRLTAVSVAQRFQAAVHTALLQGPYNQANPTHCWERC